MVILRRWNKKPSRRNNNRRGRLRLWNNKSSRLNKCKSIFQNSSIQRRKTSNFLNNILAKVTDVIDRGLSWEQTFLVIQKILEACDNSQTTLFEKLGQQKTL